MCTNPDANGLLITLFFGESLLIHCLFVSQDLKETLVFQAFLVILDFLVKRVNQDLLAWLASLALEDHLALQVCPCRGLKVTKACLVPLEEAVS